MSCAISSLQRQTPNSDISFLNLKILPSDHHASQTAKLQPIRGAILDVFQKSERPSINCWNSGERHRLSMIQSKSFKGDQVVWTAYIAMPQSDHHHHQAAVFCSLLVAPPLHSTLLVNTANLQTTHAVNFLVARAALRYIYLFSSASHCARLGQRRLRVGAPLSLSPLVTKLTRPLRLSPPARLFKVPRCRVNSAGGAESSFSRRCCCC